MTKRFLWSVGKILLGTIVISILFGIVYFAAKLPWDIVLIWGWFVFLALCAIASAYGIGNGIVKWFENEDD